MRAIRALPDNVLLLACKQRDYSFQLSSNEETTRWATNLVTLALDAGCIVPGFILMPPSDDDLETDGVRTKPVATEESEQFPVASAA